MEKNETQRLLDLANEVRDKAYAPYSNFKVGSALRTTAGKTFVGCNVENVSYPEGTCAESGAIAAMIAGGDDRIAEVAVVADSPMPVPPCGGCRQRLAEFAGPEVRVTMATTGGKVQQMTVQDLLPGKFSGAHMGSTE